jgi:hypothetical protein
VITRVLAPEVSNTMLPGKLYYFKDSCNSGSTIDFCSLFYNCGAKIYG